LSRPLTRCRLIAGMSESLHVTLIREGDYPLRGRFIHLGKDALLFTALSDVCDRLGIDRTAVGDVSDVATGAAGLTFFRPYSPNAAVPSVWGTTSSLSDG